MSRSRQFSLESVIPFSGKSQLAYYYEVPNGLEGGVVKTVPCSFFNVSEYF